MNQSVIPGDRAASGSAAAGHAHAHSRTRTAVLDGAGLRSAIASSFVKLAPRHAFANPVMAVVWLGTVLAAVATLAGTTSRALAGP